MVRTFSPKYGCGIYRKRQQLNGISLLGESERAAYATFAYNFAQEFVGFRVIKLDSDFFIIQRSYKKASY